MKNRKTYKNRGGGQKCSGMSCIETEHEPTLELDWTLVAKKIVIDDWDFIIIPKNTIVYKGIRINGRKIFQEKISYYAQLPIASYYAFDHNKNNNASFGEILCYKINHDTLLLDMTSVRNYKKIIDFLNEDEIDTLKTSFEYVKQGKNEYIQRYSDYSSDMNFIDVFNIIMTENPKVTGYSYINNGKSNNTCGFHNELMICGEQRIHPILQDNKYVWTPYFKPECILEIEYDEFTGNTIKIDTLKMEYELCNNKTFEYKVEFHINDDEFPFIQKDKEGYTWNEPFIAELLQYIKNLRSKKGRWFTWNNENEVYNLTGFPITMYPELYERDVYPEDETHYLEIITLPRSKYTILDPIVNNIVTRDDFYSDDRFEIDKYIDIESPKPSKSKSSKSKSSKSSSKITLKKRSAKKESSI